jgi:RNA polymerase sigma-70 factor, ECF subfamily
MMHESMERLEQDSAAVAAVRGGDVERYRELVERHERRVFAVAWSRLGDAALAEEATQEAFIRGYRRLWLLGDGAKFAGWIASIARHAAINLGLRHQRELDKRKRWALEQPAAEEVSAGEPNEQCAPETLRQTLAELPAVHRECLVLFYLEGKSGAEAAAALGISETSFRVRLHRARGALREQLEDKLEGSLEKLRPANSLVPVVMAGVLGSSSAKATTAGATLGVLAKFTPFKFLFLYLPFVTMLPGVFFSWLVWREQSKNYRDQGGFRARLFKTGRGRWFIWLPLLMVVIWSVVWLFGQYGNGRAFFLILAAVMLVTMANAGRVLAINRNSYSVANFAGGVLGIPVTLAISFGGSIFFWLLPWLAVQALVRVIWARKMPMRFDYNLFVRAAEGMLNTPEARTLTGRFDAALTENELFSFARFLGSRNLVNNFRLVADGLLLRLAPVKTSPRDAAQTFLFSHWSGGSTLTLHSNGTVTAQLHASDRKTLKWLRGQGLPPDAELESQVCAAVDSAWRHFRASQTELAESAVGQTPDADVFVKPGGLTKLRLAVEIGMVVLMAGMFIVMAWERLHPAAFSGLKPVSATEAQIHEFFSMVNTNPNPLVTNKLSAGGGMTRAHFRWDPANPLFSCLVLPPTNLFTPRGLQAIRDTVASDRGPLSVFGIALLRHAVAGGWISWEDLGLRPEDVGAALRSGRPNSIYTPEKWDYLLTRGRSWSCVKSESFPVMRINADGLAQLRLLRALDCLDLTDREKLIQQIASVQTLSGTPPGQPPIHDWKDVRGLFFTPGWPALHDTYFSLAALEILGGLDKIDREQCIRGILRVHRGKGYFVSPDSGGINEYHIEGDAHDTIAAFETLRILGALDRVKDLDRWQFRPQRRGVAKGDLTWYDVEAWVCQQRLERILRDRTANPQAPVRSLLMD